MKNQRRDWYIIDNEEEVFSPALLIYPERIEENIRRMIAIAGDKERLRPHVKTHKMPEVVRLQMSYGIMKFKCATISEAEMVASCGAPDILLAYQPVGPHIKRFFNLKERFRDVKFSCIVDSDEIIRLISGIAEERNSEAHLWLDINVGMNRTGIIPGEKALKLAKLVTNLPRLTLEGLHVYDGHLHEPDPVLRMKLCNESFTTVSGFEKELAMNGFKSLKIIAGGSPTFPVHSRRENVELSPGTILLWDHGYGSAFRDMDFMSAAVLFSRIISKPAYDMVCTDLGHKAVASEMPQPRIKILGLTEYSIYSHNEEHMVIRTDEARNLKIGSPLYAIPYHICPTVDRYDIVSVVRNNKVIEEWSVEARKRKLTI